MAIAGWDGRLVVRGKEWWSAGLYTCAGWVTFLYLTSPKIPNQDRCDQCHGKENKINHLLSKYSATIPNIPTPSQLTPGGSPVLQTSGGFTRDSCTQAVYAQQIMALGFRPTRGRAVIETKAYCFLVAEIPRPLRSCICCSVNNSSFLRELTNVNKNTGFLRCIHQFTSTYIYSFITRLCIRKDNTSNG